MAGEEMPPVHGVESSVMVKQANHDIFKAMVYYYTVFSRLAGTEKAMKDERETHKKMLTELAAAKDNASVARAERDEVLRTERQTKEENKTLKTERASLAKMLEAEKAHRANLEQQVKDLTSKLQLAEEELETVESNTIANFKETADFQCLLRPVFLEGYNFYKAQCSETFPDIDLSAIQPRQQKRQQQEESGAKEGEAGETGDVEGGEAPAQETGGDQADGDQVQTLEVNQVPAGAGSET